MSVFDLTNESYRDRDDKMCVPLFVEKGDNTQIVLQLSFRILFNRPSTFEFKKATILLSQKSAFAA